MPPDIETEFFTLKPHPRLKNVYRFKLKNTGPGSDNWTRKALRAMARQIATLVPKEDE